MSIRARRELYGIVRAAVKSLATEAALEAADDAGLLDQYANALRRLEAVASEAHSALVHDLTVHREGGKELREEFEIGEFA